MSKLKAGDWIEVRSEEEILRTLDTHGRLEGLPFMPEMRVFCGKRFQIFKVAHKTCDSKAQSTRRLRNVFHLTTRCSGVAHGGCQAGCLLFWKAAWLKPIAVLGEYTSLASEDRAPVVRPGFAVVNLEAETQSQAADGSVRYHCQATQICETSTPVEWWDLRQYLDDIRSGNVSLRQEVLGAVRLGLMRAGALPFLVGRFFRWVYRLIFWFEVRNTFPFLAGSVPSGVRTPSQSLGLSPKDLVRVKNYDEIIATLDSAGRNRGLTFDPEQVPYLSHTCAVSHRVERIVDEGTGQLIRINSPTVVLDEVFCQGKYGRCRLSCPRSALLFWREVWLERIPTNSHSDLN